MGCVLSIAVPAALQVPDKDANGMKQLDRSRFHELIHVVSQPSFWIFVQDFFTCIAVIVVARNRVTKKIHFSYGRRTKITENPQVLSTYTHLLTLYVVV